MEEIRYAILVGINDYDLKPLHFCEKDVNRVKATLINNCQFAECNVFSIVSTNQHPNRNIIDSFSEALDQIRTKVQPTDTILFYYSGHGKFDREVYLEYHDKSISLQSIYELINSLNPKNQVFIIDACHSGFGVEIKSSTQLDAMKQYYNERYNRLAEGLYMLCSSRSDQTSKAHVKLDNSVYTYFIIQAINTSGLYDLELNSLSLSSIHEYAVKKISLNPEYQQTPFFLSKNIGYFPFATKTINSILSSCQVKLDITDENDVYQFLENENLNLPEQFRNDFSQFFSELSLNLFRHNFAKKITLIFKENTIEIRDYSDSSFNPFTAEETETGMGVKVYRLFLQKYKNYVICEYIPKDFNTIRLTFDEAIFVNPITNPCHIDVSEDFLRSSYVMNQYNLNLDCDEIYIDVSKSRYPVSFSPRIFNTILERTKDRKPLIILRLHKDDMTKDLIKEQLRIWCKEDRIMAI